jgi:hypothetical protein
MAVIDMHTQGIDGRQVKRKDAEGGPIDVIRFCCAADYASRWRTSAPNSHLDTLASLFLLCVRNVPCVRVNTMLQ